MSTNPTDIQKRIDKEREERLIKARQALIDAEKKQGLFGAGILPAFPGIFGDTPEDSPGFVGTMTEREQALENLLTSEQLDSEKPTALSVRPDREDFVPKTSPYGTGTTQVQKSLFGSYVPAGTPGTFLGGGEVTNLTDLPFDERVKAAEDLDAFGATYDPSITVPDSLRTAGQTFSANQLRSQKQFEEREALEAQRLARIRPVRGLTESIEDYNERLDEYNKQFKNVIQPGSIANVYNLGEGTLKQTTDTATTNMNMQAGANSFFGLLSDVLLMQSLLDNRPQAPAASAPRGIAGSRLPEEDPYKRRF